MTLNILRLSTDLQSTLIKDLAAQADLAQRPKYLIEMLDRIVAKAFDELKANACSIYIIDDAPGASRERRATMRAAKGYQEGGIDLAHCRVLPAEEIPHYTKLGLTSWVISTGRSFLAESPEKLVQHSQWSGQYDETQLPNAKLELAAFLAVPVRSPQGQIIGALKAERLVDGRASSIKDQAIAEAQPLNSASFDANDQIALETLARVAGRCLTYVENARSGQLNAAITSWTLDVIAEAVAAEGELDAFLDIVVGATAAATTADSCAVFLIDESKKTLTQRAGCGSQVLRKVIRSYRLPERAQLVSCEESKLCTPATCARRADLPREERVGVTAWVAATGKSFHARNFEELQKHCHHRGKYDGPNYKSDQQCGAWLGVPLLVGGTIIGVLKIENISTAGVVDERDFTPDIQQRLDVLAQDIALAIRRLQIQSPARYEVIQNAMPTVLEILRGELDVRKLVEKVVEATAKLFDARACALFLKEGNQLIQPPWAAFGWAQRGPTVRKYDLVSLEQITDSSTPEKEVGLTVWIAVKKQSFTAKSNLELTSHPHHKGTFDEHNFNEEDRCESFMGTPLLFGKEKEEELIGVLKVETKQRSVGPDKEVAYFNEQDELVFELIAKSAAIAIQNARLLESRRLADQLMNIPYLDKVVSTLHEFIRGRVEVVSTLESTADVIRSKDPERASAIQNFASLLEPNFRVTILEQLASQMRAPLNGPLNDLLTFLVISIRAEKLSEIRALPAKKPQVAGLLRTDFFLHTCAQILFDTLDEVHAQLAHYEQEQTYRAALLECLRLLDRRRDEIEALNLFEKSLLGRVFDHWQAVIRDAANQFHDIPNCYVAGQPLRPDSPVFVGREDIFRWIKNNLHSDTQKNVLVLHGSWHTGKTSILQQLQAGPLGQSLRERPQRPLFPVFFDLQAMKDTGTHWFLLNLAEEISSTLQARGVDCPTPEEADFKEAHYRAFDTFLKKVDQLLVTHANGLLVIMLDEFEQLDDSVKEGRIEVGVFEYLRAKMQHQPSVTFILAGRHRLDEMTPAYKNIVFNVARHQEVGFLTEAEARRLIHEPVQQSGVTYEAGVVERILKLTGGHPYFIQQLCQICIDLLNQQRSGYQVTEEHLNRALDQMLSMGNDTILEDFWQSVDAASQWTLRTLAQGTTDDQLGFSASELLALAAQAGFNSSEIEDAIKKLIAHQMIIDARPDPIQVVTYRYGIDLLRLWVKRRLGEAWSS